MPSLIFFQMAWILLADIDINRHGILTIAYKYMMCHFWNLPFFSLTHFFRFVCSFCFVLFCFLWHGVSLHSPGCPGTYFVDLSGLELRNLPASASGVLVLKACATTAWAGFWGFGSFVLFCFVLFCFVLFCWISFHKLKVWLALVFKKIKIQKNYKCYEIQICLH